MGLESLAGAYVVAVTPFGERRAIDLESIDSLVDFYLERGIRGFTVLGVSGEATRLTAAESVIVADRFIRRAGRAPVLVGVSSQNVAQLAELTRQAIDLGAGGVMISPSGGLRSEDDVLRHFDQIFRAIGDTPTMLQDYPAASGVAMSVPTILRLVNEHPQITAIKHEDMPGLAKLTRLRGALARPVSILCGNNGLLLPFELGRGADGAMLGFSFPEAVVDLCRSVAAGEGDAGADRYDVYRPLLQYEAQGFWGIAVRKEVLRRRGAIRCATMRPPGPDLGQGDIIELDRLLRRLGPRILPIGARDASPVSHSRGAGDV